MGMYDTIEVGGKQGQLKCWDCEGSLYKQGETVPPMGCRDTYSIAMREGGFVNIKNCVLVSWTEKAENLPVFDKWGDPYSEGKTEGILPGEEYVI